MSETHTLWLVRARAEWIMRHFHQVNFICWSMSSHLRAERPKWCLNTIAHHSLVGVNYYWPLIYRISYIAVLLHPAGVRKKPWNLGIAVLKKISLVLQSRHHSGISNNIQTTQCPYTNRLHRLQLSYLSIKAIQGDNHNDNWMCFVVSLRTKREMFSWVSADTVWRLHCPWLDQWPVKSSTTVKSAKMNTGRPLTPSANFCRLSQKLYVRDRKNILNSCDT